MKPSCFSLKIRVLGCCSIFGIVVCSTAIILEIGLRLLERQSDFVHSVLFTTHDYYKVDRAKTIQQLKRIPMYRMHPRTKFADFVLNSNGFLTHEYIQVKPPGTKRIVYLGDSFTFGAAGIPYQQLWVQKITEWLQANSDHKVEGINLSVSGTGPRFHRGVYEVEGSPLSPDIVLLQLYIGNDLTDEEFIHITRLHKYSRLRRLQLYLRHRKVSLKTLFSDAVHHRKAPQYQTGGYIVGDYSYDEYNSYISEEDFLAMKAHGANIFLREHRERHQKNLERIVREVAQTRTMAEADGAEFYVLVAPDQLQTSRRLRSRVHRYKQTIAKQYDFGWVQRELMDRLAQEGIVALDLLPAFKAHTGDELYHYLDTHWNLVGNDLVVDEIIRFFEANGVSL